MPVITRDIDVTKRTKSQCFNNVPEMFDLCEYRNIAKRCIGAFARGPLAIYMLADEDAISHVTESLMLGHCRWKEDGGRTLRSYLNQCAIWAIQVWKTKLYKASQKPQTMSLNHEISLSTGGSTQMYEFIPDSKAKDPYELIFNNSRKEAIALLESICLTDIQRNCLYQRYINDKTLVEIAEETGVSKQAVDQSIQKGIRNLKDEYEHSAV